MSPIVKNATPMAKRSRIIAPSVSSFVCTMGANPGSSETSLPMFRQRTALAAVDAASERRSMATCGKRQSGPDLFALMFEANLT
jgi:hypothetical protein